jgi:hypothetical protein
MAMPLAAAHLMIGRTGIYPICGSGHPSSRYRLREVLAYSSVQTTGASMIDNRAAMLVTTLQQANRGTP